LFFEIHRAGSRTLGAVAGVGHFVWSPSMAREYIWLECTSCSSRNYRTPKEMRGTERLELKKYCREEQKHTVHKESRKK
jgi:large subunit ribosomal protein L33